MIGFVLYIIGFLNLENIQCGTQSKFNEDLEIPKTIEDKKEKKKSAPYWKCSEIQIRKCWAPHPFMMQRIMMIPSKLICECKRLCTHTSRNSIPLNVIRSWLYPQVQISNFETFHWNLGQIVWLIKFLKFSVTKISQVKGERA